MINRRGWFLPAAAAAAAALLSSSPPAHARQTLGKIAPQPVLVRTVVVTGARAAPLARLVAAATTATAGKLGTDETVRAGAEAVVALYRALGFPVAQVVGGEFDAATGTLHLVVAEGAVRQIVVKGNTRTRAAVVVAAMRTRPGEVYREETVREDRDRLRRLGVFDDVVVAPAPPDPGATAAAENLEDALGLVDVIVRVKEGRTGNVAATLGFGESSGLVGYVDVTENNVAGSAQRVSVQWQRFARARFEDDRLVEDDARMSYSVGYSAPLLGSTGQFSAGARFYDQNTVFQPLFAGSDESIRSYERRRGGTVRLGRTIAQGLSLFASARRDEVGYDPVPARLNPPLRALAGASGVVGALGATLVADSRDAADSPRRGFLATLSYENAGSFLGGDRRFDQSVLDTRHYLPLGNRAAPAGPSLALRVLGGTSGGNVPLSEQFFVGGYELLRGYDLYSIRGDRLFLASAEARVPLGQGIQGVVFADTGNAWEPGRAASLGDLKAGAGVGLRFLTPIGPVRLDAAYGSGFHTYVSLGQAY